LVNVLPVGGHANLLAIMIPSLGNCGDFQFSVLGPEDRTGRRSRVGGKALHPACGEGIKLVPSANTIHRPAIVFDGLDGYRSGKGYWDNQRWEWTGSSLVFVKSFDVVFKP
jgi:hypothetical protein